MKLVSFHAEGRIHVGVLDAPGATVCDLTRCGIAASMLELITWFDTLRDAVEEALSSGRHRLPVQGITLVAPIPEPKRNLFCVGKNYSAHAKEFGTSGFDAGATGGDEIPELPIVFTKPPSTVIGPYDTIPRHLDPHDSVDYEGEFTVVIGKGGRMTEGEDPMSRVFGYTLVNDVTSRELQRRHKQWLLGKGIDGFCPMGPVIATCDEIPLLEDVHIETWVNGERRQFASLSQMIFKVPRLIAEIGRSISLQPGDLIATGTPEGVGIGFRPPRYLQRGDVVKVICAPIGALENPVG